MSEEKNDINTLNNVIFIILNKNKTLEYCWYPLSVRKMKLLAQFLVTQELQSVIKNLQKYYANLFLR